MVWLRFTTHYLFIVVVTNVYITDDQRRLHTSLTDWARTSFVVFSILQSTML